MFNRKPLTRDRAPVATSLIAEGIRIAGNVSFGGALFVSGTIDGQIGSSEPTAVLTVADQGLVNGDIRVPSAIIHGHVRGNIHVTQTLELAGTARIDGDVYYRSLVVAAGAQVNGHVRHCADGGSGVPASVFEPAGAHLSEMDVHHHAAVTDEPDMTKQAIAERDASAFEENAVRPGAITTEVSTVTTVAETASAFVVDTALTDASPASPPRKRGRLSMTKRDV